MGTSKSTNRKTLVRKLYLALGAFLVALLVVEVVLQIHNPLSGRVKGDRILLPVNRVYSITNEEIPDLDKKISHRKNALGFRGADPPTNAGEHFTIITVGGSTTECFYLTDGKTWPDLLSNRLSQSFDKLWLNNAGRSGGHTLVARYSAYFAVLAEMKIHPYSRFALATAMVSLADNAPLHLSILSTHQPTEDSVTVMLSDT